MTLNSVGDHLEDTTLDTVAYMQAAEKLYCPHDGGVRGPEQTIEFESNQIKLDIPTEGIELQNGWKVTPILNPVVSIYFICPSLFDFMFLTLPDTDNKERC